MRNYIIYFIGFVLFGATTQLAAQNAFQLSGKVIDENQEAVPYCSIYIPSLGKSNMANALGEFSLSVPEGSYTIVFQSIGYQKRSIQRTIDKPLEDMEVQLQSMAIQIKEVTVDPSSEDPAYNIIRRSIAMATLYKKQIEAYRCSIYVRSFYDTDDIPWFVEKLADEEDLEDMKAGDINETLTYYSFKRPNTVEEKIIGKKSGRNDTLKSGSSYINLNFYDLGGNEIINPLSQYALSVYKYEFQYSFFEEAQKVHKIKVIPRRNGNDLMRGTLYINDGLWNLNKVDVEFDQPLTRIKYKQIYNEVSPHVWMPTNHNFRVELSAVGFKMHLEYLATLNDLIVETNDEIQFKIIDQLKLSTEEDSVPLVQKNLSERKQKKMVVIDEKIDALLEKEKLNNREAIKLVKLYKKQERISNEKEENDTINKMQISSNRKLEYADDAFSLSDSVWNASREIPLSVEEIQIYADRDSLNKRDAGDTVYNAKRSKFGNVFFFNGQLQSKNKKVFYRPFGLFSGFEPSFNTVDGLHLRKSLFGLTAHNEKGQHYQLDLDGSYAFARERLMGNLTLAYAYSPEDRGQLSLSLGRRSRDFNGNEGYTHELFNTFSTLLFTDNYVKFYQEDYVNLVHQVDVINGLVWKTDLMYSDRLALQNHSDFTLIGKAKDYSSNIPENESLHDNLGLLSNNTSFIFGTSIEYTFKQYYRMWGKEKRIVPSYSPILQLEYQQGLNGIMESKSKFNALHFSVRQSRPYRLLDEISYKLGVGRYLERDRVFFADFRSFEVEPFYLMQSASTHSFKQLGYYQANTTSNYLEAHFSVMNDHLLLKYLPLLNNTELKEKIELKTLLMGQQKPYYEVGYSLDQFFLLFNVGVYAGFSGSEHQSTGIRLSLNIE